MDLKRGDLVNVRGHNCYIECANYKLYSMYGVESIDYDFVNVKPHEITLIKKLDNRELKVGVFNSHVAHYKIDGNVIILVMPLTFSVSIFHRDSSFSNKDFFEEDIDKRIKSMIYENKFFGSSFYIECKAFIPNKTSYYDIYNTPDIKNVNNIPYTFI
jgi:hypothetical protein